MSILNLNELNKEVKDNYNIETFKIILAQVHRHIKELAKTHKECVIKPKEYIFGRPLYNYNELLDYLIFELIDNGLKAHNTNEGIYISWRKEDINMKKYMKKINPLDQKLSVVNKNTPNNPQQTMVKVSHKNVVDYIPVNLNKK